MKIASILSVYFMALSSCHVGNQTTEQINNLFKGTRILQYRAKMYMQMLYIFWPRKKYTQIEIFAKLDTFLLLILN